MKIDPRVSAALQEIEVTRGVPRQRIIEVLVEAMKAAYERKHGPTTNLEIEVDLAAATIDAYLSKKVVPEVADPGLEISLEEAKTFDPNAEEGDSLLIETEMGDVGYWGVATAKTMMKNLGYTLPGLSNFWMHGQWVAVGGGLPPAGMNGRALAKMICRKHGLRFTASE